MEKTNINQIINMDENEKQILKDELKYDLNKGYYKMSQAKIISLIGCTITICISCFGVGIYIDRHFTRYDDKIEQLNSKFEDLKNKQENMWKYIIHSK